MGTIPALGVSTSSWRFMIGRLRPAQRAGILQAPTTVHSGVVTLMTTIAGTVDKQGRLFCGHQTLATMTSFSVRWVRHLLKELVAMGVLIRERRGGGWSRRLRFSAYRLAFPGGDAALSSFLEATSPAVLTGRAARRRHTGDSFMRRGERTVGSGNAPGPQRVQDSRDPSVLARQLRPDLVGVLGQQTDQWLEQVVAHVLKSATSPVLFPAKYVLRVVTSDPGRFKPTPVPPRTVPHDEWAGDQCQCARCKDRAGPAATPEQIRVIRARARGQSPP